MPLQYQPVTMKFGSSMDESVAGFSLPSPLLKNITNARAYKTGHLKKRPGWQSLSDIGGVQNSQVVECNGTLMNIRPQTIGNFAARQLRTINSGAGRFSIGTDAVDGANGTRSLSEVDVLGRDTIWRDESADGADLGVVVGGFSSTPDHNFDPVHNIEVFAWTSRRGALYCVMAVAIDATTKKPVSPVQVVSITTGTPGDHCIRPRVVFVTDNLHVIYERPHTNELRIVTYDCAFRFWGADATLVNDLKSSTLALTFPWDACSYVNGGEGTAFHLIYATASPGLMVKVFDAGAVPTLIASSASTIPLTGSVSIYSDLSQALCWVAVYTAGGGGGVISSCINPLTLAVVNTAVLEGVTRAPYQVTMTAIAATTVVVAWTTPGDPAGDYRALTKYRTFDSSGTLGVLCAMPSVHLISRAFSGPLNSQYGGQQNAIYAAVLYDGSGECVSGAGPTIPQTERSSGFSTAFTLRLGNVIELPLGDPSWSWRAVASWAMGFAGRFRCAPGTVNCSTLSNVCHVVKSNDNAFQPFCGDDEFRFALGIEVPTEVAANISVAGQQGYSGVDLCRMSIPVGNVTKSFCAAIGGNIVISGGIPHVFDGQTVTEYGFLVPPENGQGLLHGSGGGLLAGTYAAQIVEEYRLATGDVIRSAPALLKDTANLPTFTAVANDRLDIVVPPLSLTNKYCDLPGASDTLGAIFKFFRTEANGSVYYYENDQGVANGVVTNLPLLSVNLTTTITQSDSSILSNEEIYTTGGQLPNYPLPPLSHLVNHQDRIYGISAEDRKQLVFTHIYEPGALPMWHPDLVLQLEDEMVALASLDSTLVILCKNGLYILTGQGPDNQGLNSDFNGPDRLNGPHGCVSALSVVTIPLGVIFQAPTGFVMIDRKLGVTRIGGPVEDSLAAFPIVLDSCAWPINEWAYWAVRDTIGGARVIAFDWRHNVWSVDVIQATTGEDRGTVIQAALVSMAVHQDLMFGTFANDNTVLQHIFLHFGFDDPSGTWIPMSVLTAWINMGSNQAYQRTRWLGVLAQYIGPHGLGVQLTIDYGTNSENWSWVDTELSALTPYQHLKHHLGLQRATAVQIELGDFQDTATSPFTAGGEWIGLVFDMGLKANVAKLQQGAMK